MVVVLEGAVENIRSSSKTEKEKVEDLKKLNTEVDNFITVTVNRDNAAKEELNKAKEDFYTKYSYLKPECEKGFIEKVVDTVESAAEWCCEHWKLIVTIVIVIVAVALIWTGVGGVILAGACWGAISGAVIGGISGGLESMANGGSFLDGFEDGAFSGAISGAICGAAFAGIGQLGAVCGKFVKCTSTFGKFIKGTAAVSKGISMAMGGFDTLAMLDRAFGTGAIYDLNSKLHSNKAYNFFQTGVSGIAVFTGGMTSTMKCFIAGTLIATELGFARIESIKPGDLVLSTNSDTMETGYKKVLEKYVRKTRELVHIVVGGEEIVSTPDHPYFVVGRGFVNAGQLCIGSPLQNADGKILEVEQIYKEYLEEAEEVTVYNFQVEDWHTYHVGEMEVLVHNAGPNYNNGKSGSYSSLRDLMSPEEAARYDGYWNNVADDMLKSNLGDYRRAVLSGDITKTTGGKINSKVVTAAIDTNTGDIYYGISGMNNNPTRNMTNPQMQEILNSVNESMTNYPLENCGEFNAINNALNNGANIQNLRVYSIDRVSGNYKAPCINCQNLYGNIVHFTE